MRPSRIVSPGDILRHELESRGITQRELSAMIDLSEKAISMIVNGKKQMTPSTCIKLGVALGTTPQFWNDLEANFRLELALWEMEVK